MSGHTPGPWGWFGNASSNTIQLATVNQGRRYVMLFRRWGMAGAQPVFQPADRMVPASQLCTFEVGDRDVVGVDAAKANASVYRYDIRGIDCADARLIAAAPDLLEALEAMTRVFVPFPREDTEGWREEHEAYEEARAAIALATGAK